MKSFFRTHECYLQVYFIIKSVLRVNIIKVLGFFGSRARGDYSNEESDWDFLIVVDKVLEFKEKHKIIIRVKRKLAKMGIPNDIIVQSKSRFDLLKNYPGHISYVAKFEGITI